METIPPWTTLLRMKKTDRMALKSRKRQFKGIGIEMRRVFDTSKEGLEIVAITHSFTYSIVEYFATHKKMIGEAIHRVFQLNFVYPIDFRQNLKLWEIEKLNFANKYSNMQRKKKERLEGDGKEWFIHVELISTGGNRNKGIETSLSRKVDSTVMDGIEREIELVEGENVRLLPLSEGECEKEGEELASSSSSEDSVYESIEETGN